MQIIYAFFCKYVEVASIEIQCKHMVQHVCECVGGWGGGLCASVLALYILFVYVREYYMHACVCACVCVCAHVGVVHVCTCMHARALGRVTYM